MEELEDMYARLREVIRAASAADPRDLVDLEAHAHIVRAVRMAGTPPRCAGCGEPMPCPTVRQLAAHHGFDEFASAEPTHGVRMDVDPSVTGTTGGRGPTGVRMDTSDVDEPEA